MSLRWVEGLEVSVALMSVIYMANLRACSKRKLFYVELAVPHLGNGQKLYQVFSQFLHAYLLLVYKPC